MNHVEYISIFENGQTQKSSRSNFKDILKFSVTSSRVKFDDRRCVLVQNPRLKRPFDHTMRANTRNTLLVEVSSVTKWIDLSFMVTCSEVRKSG